MRSPLMTLAAVAMLSLAAPGMAQVPASTRAPAAVPPPLPAALRQLPASFGGDLPCADCDGVRYRLNLFPDGAFYLGMVHLGKSGGESLDDIGRWMVSSNQKVLVLKGGREAAALFRIVDATTLRKLDLEGRDIQSTLDYAVTRTAGFERLEPKLVMRGMYRYMADAGIFTECSTGQRWPVAQEGDNARLEREYGTVRKEPGGPVLVSVEGRIAMRPKMEGPGLQPALVPVRFIGAFPERTCGPRAVPATLETTAWKLTRLGDAAVASKDSRREAGIAFDAAAKRVSGFGGCNGFTGGYARSGVEGITFGPAAGTMMACPDGMETEDAFLKALSRVKTYNVLGTILEMYDEAGALLARFEARAEAPAK
jgi:copper homeostasis protein (lipoprotein)